MKLINTTYSLQSKGHYSPAVIHDNIAYIAGQLPIDYEAGQTEPIGDVREQTKQALKNLDSVLKLCGTDKYHVLKTTVYIPDIQYWPLVNEVYAEFFCEHKPARTIVPTSTLHFGAKIEIEAIACID